MASTLEVISPADSQPLLTRPFASHADIDAVLERSREAFRHWRRVPLQERVRLVLKFVDCFVAKKDAVAKEITQQMGRPIRYTAGEVRGFEQRARYAAAIAASALADYEPEEAAGAPAPLKRYIRREPVGPVLILASWNYPYLVSVNGVVPALLAGNTVVLKQSPQTPLCAERFADAFQEAGLPDGVFQYLHITHEAVPHAIQHPATAYVNYTGSMEGGLAVQKAAAGRFIGVGLELGGKDPAYVRSDADLEHAVEQLVDGAFFNSGQSCCGIERIYVASEVYDQFVEKFTALAKQYKLGDPLDPEVTLGPMVRAQNADNVRAHIQDALERGAQGLVDPALFPASKPGTPYLAPQVLVNVDHTMRVMKEETFGPVVGVMKVASDEEAVRLMNDSSYGLTASIWTRDTAIGERIGDQLETGTVFTNRCDYVDPALAWTGAKDSGRGCTLSKFGFDALTRPKSYNINVGPQ
ncbi:aldehyde dehydrogenase [Thamnocephalis sphaerospora]|uniref:Aldehyde dehydrogenase n=1 Tax=Thamnocephalis sphaerospora TaxID=78915 RepID=A0A4P9XTR6_9FUNG|nr:aldehyde dehydrogenase [Thamnocephalis sphaerospora]|eukprot:RKP09382.1 aldehyde dehydrogenase [Thamnocephalis sphaerospora]